MTHANCDVRYPAVLLTFLITALLPARTKPPSKGCPSKTSAVEPTNLSNLSEDASPHETFPMSSSKRTKLVNGCPAILMGVLHELFRLEIQLRGGGNRLCPDVNVRNGVWYDDRTPHSLLLYVLNISMLQNLRHMNPCSHRCVSVGLTVRAMGSRTVGMHSMQSCGVGRQTLSI